MFTISDKEFGPVIEQKGRRPRASIKRTEHPRDACKRIGDSARGISASRQKMINKIVLKLFGYREKTEGMDKILEESCRINLETKARLNDLRATLNGEKYWFEEK